MNAFLRLTMTLCSIAALTACAPEKGEKGDIGPQGQAGLNGSDGASIVGPQGPAGINGIDANPITIVKFCPGETIYPTQFNEIGFCVAGRVYGTYSTHGGFSTELPPGRYSSNAVGSSCSFEIKANCEVAP